VTLSGEELAPEIEESIGVPMAVIVRAPLRGGFQVHVATILGEVPEVGRFLHPGINELLIRKVTLAGLLKTAVMTESVLKIGGVFMVREIKKEVSLKSVTEIVIACVRILPAVSTALSVNS
jgi:hypothetical protein